ncbi:MAG: hypothetical protein ABI324_02685 [Ktedonobacteraceae bacterium]
MEQLIDDECLALIDLLSKIPHIHIPEERFGLLAGLPQELRNRLNSNNNPTSHLSDIVETLGSEAYFKLNDGTYPIFMVIRNAQRKVGEIAPLHTKLQILLNNICIRLNIDLQKKDSPVLFINVFLETLEDLIRTIEILQGELQAAHLAFNGHLLPQKCREKYLHLTGLCETVHNFTDVFHPLKNLPLEIIANGVQLDVELVCFIGDARMLDTHIKHFCDFDAFRIIQTKETREVVQQYMERLIARCISIVLEAKKVQQCLKDSAITSAKETDTLQ